MSNSFTIKNKNGIEVNAIKLGASLVAIKTPDHKKRFQNIILSHQTPEAYEFDTDYLGSIVGRFAGRIANSEFTIDGKHYPLSKNEGMNHLHGGIEGWSKKVWTLNAQDETFLEFSLVSPHGEEGYPGEVSVHVRYSLNDEDQLTILFRATTTKPTHLNLTQHSYFSLSGDPTSTIENDSLQIHSRAYLPCDLHKIPTGKLVPASFEKQILRQRVLDQTWILENNQSRLLLAATLSNPDSGRLLNVYTTEPSIHIYTGDGLRAPFKKRTGVCLETQHYPNSPNQADFPSTLLQVGKVFESKTVWEFRTI